MKILVIIIIIKNLRELQKITMLPGTSHILRSWFYPSREAFYLACEYSHFSLLADIQMRKW